MYGERRILVSMRLTIQTYIGHVLISVNPFRDLGIYTDQVLESYKGKNRLEVGLLGSMLRHMLMCL